MNIRNKCTNCWKVSSNHSFFVLKNEINKTATLIYSICNNFLEEVVFLNGHGNSRGENVQVFFCFSKFLNKNKLIFTEKPEHKIFIGFSFIYLFNFHWIFLKNLPELKCFLKHCFYQKLFPHLFKTPEIEFNSSISCFLHTQLNFIALSARQTLNRFNLSQNKKEMFVHS